jgi:hypothetical protein
MIVGLDVGERVGGKVGLECYLPHDEKLNERLAHFLDYLRRAGLCTEAKANALPGWYGLTHERWCREAWPADLRDHPDRPSAGHSGGFVRTLHHVKISFNPPAPLEAKAYLAAFFVWVDNAALKRGLAAQAAGAAPQS